MKIFAAEDNTVSRVVLLRSLRRLGHKIVEAYDGDTAWDLRQKPPDVRVRDWSLPGSDGLALCRKVRGRAVGVDDFLAKPLSFAELWTRLNVAERILRFPTQVRPLEAMLPIYAYCKKIRDGKSYRQPSEGYISARTGADFSTASALIVARAWSCPS